MTASSVENISLTSLYITARCFGARRLDWRRMPWAKPLARLSSHRCNGLRVEQELIYAACHATALAQTRNACRRASGRARQIAAR